MANPAPPITETHERYARHRRAAIWLWILGGIEGVICLRLLNIAPDFKKLSAENVAHMMNLPTVDPRLSGEAVAMALSIVIGLFGMLPVLAYLSLAFGVRRGQAAAMWGVQIVLFVQLAMVGFYLITGTWAALQQGNPVLMTGIVLGLGTVAAVLLGVLRSVRGAQRSVRGNENLSTDPWRAQG